jgi:hypothetical protein
MSAEVPAEPVEEPAQTPPDLQGTTGTVVVERMGDEEAARSVRVRCDRPGERAVSGVMDGRELIQEVAEAIGVTVTIEEEPA